MLDGVKNFAKGVVSTGYDSAATEITLESGHGARFPDPAIAAYNVVWFNFAMYPDPSDDPNKEIVRVTGKTGDVLTITRAQESTLATNKNTSGGIYEVRLVLTAKMIADIELALTSDNIFEIDIDGGLMPTESGDFNENFELDENGDIVPK